MIDLYYWPTPNGHKITIFLEEAGLPYKIIPVNITKGEQFTPEFLKISPNNKMPAIVDHAPPQSQQPLAIFESGAILLYLAEKTKHFIPMDKVGFYKTVEWLFWQVAGLGPMTGQSNHFRNQATDKIPYAIERYSKEVHRLFTVLEKQLVDKEYITGDYSIADMACYPWIVPYKAQGINIEEFPELERWFISLQARPAIQRAYAKGEEYKPK